MITFDIFGRTTLLASFVLKMEAVFFFEILAVANSGTWCYS